MVGQRLKKIEHKIVRRANNIKHGLQRTKKQIAETSLAIGGIGTAAAGVSHATEKINTFLQQPDATNEYETIGDKLFDELEEGFNAAVDGVDDFFAEIGKSFSNVREAASGINNFFRRAPKEIGEEMEIVFEKIPDTVQAIPEKIEAKVEEFFEDVAELPEQIVEHTEQLVEDIPQEIENFVEDIPEEIHQVVEQIPEVLEELPKNIVHFVEDQIPEDIQEIPQQIVEQVESIPKVLEELEEIPQEILQIPQQIKHIPDLEAQLEADLEADLDAYFGYAETELEALPVQVEQTFTKQGVKRLRSGVRQFVRGNAKRIKYSAEEEATQLMELELDNLVGSYLGGAVFV